MDQGYTKANKKIKKRCKNPWYQKCYCTFKQPHFALLDFCQCVLVFSDWESFIVNSRGKTRPAIRKNRVNHGVRYCVITLIASTQRQRTVVTPRRDLDTSTWLRSLSDVRLRWQISATLISQFRFFRPCGVTSFLRPRRRLQLAPRISLHSCIQNARDLQVCVFIP